MSIICCSNLATSVIYTLVIPRILNMIIILYIQCGWLVKEVREGEGREENGVRLILSHNSVDWVRLNCDYTQGFHRINDHDRKPWVDSINDSISQVQKNELPVSCRIQQFWVLICFALSGELMY